MLSPQWAKILNVSEESSERDDAFERGLASFM